MRLICPNCGAQYEVPPEAVPPAGRDVQCSACQHVWFEKGPPPRLLNPQPWEEVPRVEGDDEEEDDLADLRDAPPPMPAPLRRVDPEVSRILREEAEREARARAEEAARRAGEEAPAALQTPSGPPDDPVERAVADLARQDAEQRATAPAAAEAKHPVTFLDGSQPSPASPPRLRPAEGVPAPEAAPPVPPQRPSRPARREEGGIDVDQINATLRSQADRLGAKAPRIEGAGRSGGSFGRGFWGTLLVLAVLAALYVFRPEIVEAVPSAGALLDPYAEAVDAGRLWLDRQIAGFLGAGTAAAPAD